MTLIRVPEISRNNKRTWPIKGRGLGVIVGGEHNLMNDLAYGGEVEVSLTPGGMVRLKNNRGKTFLREMKAFLKDLEDSGIDPTTILPLGVE